MDLLDQKKGTVRKGGEGVKERAACGISFEGGIHTCHTWAPSKKSREEHKSPHNECTEQQIPWVSIYADGEKSYSVDSEIVVD